MYPAIKSTAISEGEAREIAGNKAVDEVLAESCDFTSRVIDDVDVVEMSATVDFNDGFLTVLYLVDRDATYNCDDLGNLDYSNYTFVIS